MLNEALLILTCVCSSCSLRGAEIAFSCSDLSSILGSLLFLRFLASLWEGHSHDTPECTLDYMLIVANSVSSQESDGQETEGKVEDGQGKVDAYSGPAILTRELLQALGE